jgi:hypothetical protein
VDIGCGVRLRTTPTVTWAVGDFNVPFLLSVFNFVEMVITRDRDVGGLLAIRRKKKKKNENQGSFRSPYNVTFQISLFAPHHSTHMLTNECVRSVI